MTETYKTLSHKVQALNDAAAVLGGVIIAALPQNRARTVALMRLDETVMWATAGIAEQSAENGIELPSLDPDARA